MNSFISLCAGGTTGVPTHYCPPPPHSPLYSVPTFRALSKRAAGSNSAGAITVWWLAVALVVANGQSELPYCIRGLDFYCCGTKYASSDGQLDG